MSFCKFNHGRLYLLLLLFQSAFGFMTLAQSCDSLAGKWINQDSSILQFSIETDGMIKGHYQSNASDDSTLFPLQGLVNRAHDLVTLSFAVSWGDYGSITSWTGYCKAENTTPTITTMWHLVRPYVDEDWERVVTNKSTFVPHHE